MKYDISGELNMDFNAAILLVKEELKKEGFGVITEIDVQKTMKEKLGIDYKKYVILGACNPTFANKALEIEENIGLLLPCNVILYEKNEKIIVAAINPTISMEKIKNKNLANIAKEVEIKLRKVIDGVKK